MIRDESLALPEPTPPPGALRGPSDSLARAGSARGRPFALATARVHVTGSELAGVRAVSADGWPLLAELACDAGVSASVVMSPAEMRRELVGPGGSVLETVLAGDRMGGIVAEWRPAAPAAARTMTLRWSIPVRGTIGALADDALEAWRTGEEVLAVVRRLAPRAANHVLCQLTPAPRWRVSAGVGRVRVEAVVAVPRDGRATLLAASGRTHDDAAAALRALAAAPAVEARLERSVTDLCSTRLCLDTGVRELDDALPWAAVRLRGALGPSGFRRGSQNGGAGDTVAPLAFPLDDDSDAAWAGFGALASGDVAAARRAADRGLDHPLHALLLGWIVGWTGDPGLLEVRHLDAVQAAASLDPAALDSARRTVWRAALDAWLEAAECLGDPPWTEALRARRATLDEPGPSPRAGRPLPMVGTPPSSADAPHAALVEAVLAGGRRWTPPVGDPDSAVERGLRAWAAYASGYHAEGFRLLRSHLAAAFEVAPGSWRAGPRHPRWDDAAAAGLAPAATLFGMLGARAEAWYGRLRLAPRIPDHWTRAAVESIQVGDARVALAYSRDGDGHTFRIRQVGGRVPLTLVFEPEVPVAGPVRTFVEAAPAEVGREPAGERVRVRLQLPLDRDREVRVEPQHPAADGDRPTPMG